MNHLFLNITNPQQTKGPALLPKGWTIFAHWLPFTITLGEFHYDSFNATVTLAIALELDSQVGPGSIHFLCAL